MKRFFCYGKNDFCKEEVCRESCDFFDDSGGEMREEETSPAENAIGKVCDCDRLRETEEDDQKEADIKSCALYRLAISTYGPEAQTVMVFEEMAELQKELCKHARGTDNREAIAEEIADVQIMLEQMMELHGCKDAVLCYKRHKLERLAERIKKLKGESDGV